MHLRNLLVLLIGLKMLVSGGPAAAVSQDFLANHHAIQISLVVQLALFLSIIAIAVFKPSIRLRRRQHE